MFQTSRRALPALLGLAAAARVARAQAPWPSRPLRFVVPWPPGGLNDLIARAFNDRVGAALGQTIVNDFKPGAGGRIGVAEVARAAPDGYVIGMGNLGPLTIFPNLYRDMPFDVARDLAPVTMFAASPLVLVVNKDLPAQSVADLIALAKARPGRLNYGSVGIGTAQHLIFEMFRQRDGIAMEHVPYRGNTDSLIALLANDIQAMFETLPTILPAIRDGRVRALAVTTPTRVPQLPEVPTLAEAGQPGIEVSTWYAVIAPARTPDAVLDRLYAVYTEVAQRPDMQQFLAEQGLIYLPNTRAGFAERIAAESARWAAIIRERGISVN
ncbi:Bug family tripartite tricarboxylate transporter substrate binding protein [Neoroseomonas oryzicola]|uniref:Tripartite tricarboxylate transporter substrate binding protein n=1 Tax=Neoroseomonas oryzicola TaxID=535904 RepID=A0A9X9WNC0_9PROT|nr:tripartite tricarboxylate transporter substrate binding protein [Neoroseomonas oryzicola]MBR0661830.1 tripartite tricarboxylate transporter substrate binding protein [Neoroseomonas oryzicola]NKE20051.1 tripartite tricarboxylate transporter substrate binding protein [Neoroseomonas oryzicola]